MKPLRLRYWQGARPMTARKPDRFLAFTAAALRVAIAAGAVILVASVIALAWLWPHLWRGMP